MSDNTSLDIAVGMPSELEQVIDRLAHISGIDKHQLQKMKRDKVYALLSTHLHQLSEEEQKLLAAHDQNTQVDQVTAADKWKLVKRGVIKEKKNEFGSMPKAAYEALKFLIENVSIRSRLAAENPGAERPITLDPLAAPVKKTRLTNIPRATAANINIAPKTEKIDVSTASPIKDFFRKWSLRIDGGEVMKGK